MKATDYKKYVVEYDNKNTVCEYYTVATTIEGALSNFRDDIPDALVLKIRLVDLDTDEVDVRTDEDTEQAYQNGFNAAREYYENVCDVLHNLVGEWQDKYNKVVQVKGVLENDKEQACKWAHYYMAKNRIRCNAEASLGIKELVDSIINNNNVQEQIHNQYDEDVPKVVMSCKDREEWWKV